MNEVNDVLPIEAFKSMILASDARYIIVEAETGSGKSTMVPQWYHELGMSVLVTEPLIETVIGTSEYVASLMGVPFGTTVGYRVSEGRKDSPDTRILYCTDGLALVRELSSANRFDILVIDELHEWNKNQSTLEAWAWKHLLTGDSYFKKIVILSATLDSGELSRKRDNAPVFKVPGRQFPIVDRSPRESMEDDIKSLVREGYDVLAFMPGKAEIKDLIAKLENIGAELIPFYSELTREEKNRAYKSYGRPKVIVSTNSLETGRTIVPSPGRKLAVVDSGMERRIELLEVTKESQGIEALVLAPIAIARAQQRRGRTGRVGSGVYINHCPFDQRMEHPVPEILRTRLDQTVLRLAMVGYDATELPFFHDLDHEAILSAKTSLKALGAFGSNGEVTKIGASMARMPVSVQHARMLVEAQKLDVVEDVLTIISILENGSLRTKDYAWRRLTREEKSDPLVELDLFNACKTMDGEAMRKNGIFAPAYFRAIQFRKKLRESIHGVRLVHGKVCDRNLVLKACVAGMVDHLYRGSWGSYLNGGSTPRRIDERSVLAYSTPEWVVGKPITIKGLNKYKQPFSIPLIVQVSEVDPKWLMEVAPQLVKVEEGIDPYYDFRSDSVSSVSKTTFNGAVIREERVGSPNHPKASEVFVGWMATEMMSIYNY